MTRVCCSQSGSFREYTVVMMTLWPNLIIQQQSNTLAMRQIVRGAWSVRVAVDVFRL